MANIKSAKKRISVIARRKQENRFVKSTLSTYIKKFRTLIAEGKVAEAEKFLPEVVSYAHNAAGKGVLPKKTASRKVSRLSLLLHKAKRGELKVVEAKTAKKPAKTAVKAVAPEAKVKAEVKAAPKVETKKEVPAKKDVAKAETAKAPVKAKEVKIEVAPKLAAKKEIAKSSEKKAPAAVKESVKPAKKSEVTEKLPAKKAATKTEAKPAAKKPAAKK